MARDTSGSIKSVVINGVSYDALADADFGVTPSRYKNESIATSGRNIRKRTRQTEDVKSVTIACNGDERTAWKSYAENDIDITLAYTTAAGDTYRATGWVDFETWNNQDNKASVTLFPRQGWDSFIAV
jgi:hypothetical protein